MTGPGGAPFGPCPGATPEGSPCPRADWEGVRTWESGGPMERMRVFVGILRFFSNRQDWLTRSHVRRPPCVHMGARQLFLTDARKPRNHAKNRPLCRQSPSLPCATPSPGPSERPARPPFAEIGRIPRRDRFGALVWRPPGAAALRTAIAPAPSVSRASSGSTIRKGPAGLPTIDDPNITVPAAPAGVARVQGDTDESSVGNLRREGIVVGKVERPKSVMAGRGVVAGYEEYSRAGQNRITESIAVIESPILGAIKCSSSAIILLSTSLLPRKTVLREGVVAGEPLSRQNIHPLKSAALRQLGRDLEPKALSLRQAFEKIAPRK